MDMEVVKKWSWINEESFWKGQPAAPRIRCSQGNPPGNPKLRDEASHPRSPFFGHGRRD
jgi:hypothetical protein